MCGGKNKQGQTGTKNTGPVCFGSRGAQVRILVSRRLKINGLHLLRCRPFFFFLQQSYNTAQFLRYFCAVANEFPHISELTEEHALEAASLTGFQFHEADRTRYGWVLYSKDFHLPFVFVVRGVPDHRIRFGLEGVLTENIWRVCNFLQIRYRFADGPETI